MNNYQEKYNRLAQAIFEASEATPARTTLRLSIDPNSSLSDLRIQDIDAILENLAEEDAIRDYDTTTEGSWPIGDPIPPHGKIELKFDKGKGFDSWYAAHTKKMGRKLSDLSQVNFEKILDLILEIDDRLQIKPSSTLKINSRIWLSEEKLPVLWAAVDLNANDCAKFRADAIQYLEDEGVILNFEVQEDDEQIIILKIDVPKCLKFKKEVDAEAARRITTVKRTAKPVEPPETNRPKNAEQKIYEIRYTNAGEILLNDFLFARPDYDGENHRVFEYVFKNPNRDIPLKEIEMRVSGTDIGKSLSKIVDNWGFKGDIRKAFFQVSQSIIKFRNPIYQKDLDNLHITRLRFPRS